jgi:hypothetical protein
MENKYANSNTNFNNSKGFDISNLNFKSLKKLNTINQKEINKTSDELSHISLPNDNNTELKSENQSSQNFLQTFKSKKTRFYSQTNLNSGKVDLYDFSYQQTGRDTHPSKDESTYQLQVAAISPRQNNKVPFNQDYDEISDVSMLRIMIKNLESELKEKNDEIKILNKNFKEKINLIENENKMALENLENSYKLQIFTTNANHKNLLQDLTEENLKSQKKYEELLKKVLKEFNYYKQTCVSSNYHQEKVGEVNFKWKEHYEKMKISYEKKIKDLILHVNNPEFNLVIEKLKFFITHVEKFEKILKINFLENSEFDLNYDLKEVYAYLDKLKIKILQTDVEFKTNLIDIKTSIENKFGLYKNKNRDKLEELKEIVKKKFSEIENMNTFVEFDVPLISSKKEKTNLNNNKEEMKFSSSLLKKAKAPEALSHIDLEIKDITIKDNFNTFKNQSIDKSEIEHLDRVNLNQFNFSENKQLPNESILNTENINTLEYVEVLDVQKRVSAFSAELNVIFIYKKFKNKFFVFFRV